MPDDPGESSIISALTDGPHPGVRVGPGDDCAVLQDGTVLTVDTIVEGVHWDDRFGPEDLGWRLAMVNASDVAAMGATPSWCLLALSLPRPDMAWVEAFSRGLHAALATLGAPLIGGDTTRSATATLSLTMAGKLVAEPLLRTGGQVGDGVWVSGLLGSASGAFHMDLPELRPALLRPSPPLELGPTLAREGLASAAMDLSDGLRTDLERLCRASGCGALVRPELLPVHPALRAACSDVLPHAVAFGDDYQLLVTAPPRSSERLLELGLTRVGRLVPGQTVRLQGRDWPQSWQHFQATRPRELGA
jgi:thiamine-monophosphate kinase